MCGPFGARCFRALGGLEMGLEMGLRGGSPEQVACSVHHLMGAPLYLDPLCDLAAAENAVLRVCTGNK